MRNLKSSVNVSVIHILLISGEWILSIWKSPRKCLCSTCIFLPICPYILIHHQLWMNWATIESVEKGAWRDHVANNEHSELCLSRCLMNFCISGTSVQYKTCGSCIIWRYALYYWPKTRSDKYLTFCFISIFLDQNWKQYFTSVFQNG